MPVGKLWICQNAAGREFECPSRYDAVQKAFDFLKKQREVLIQSYDGAQAELWVMGSEGPECVLQGTTAEVTKSMVPAQNLRIVNRFRGKRNQTGASTNVSSR